METWTKYFYICAQCDSSIEVVTKKEPKRDPVCSCGTKKQSVILIQKEAVSG